MPSSKSVNVVPLLPTDEVNYKTPGVDLLKLPVASHAALAAASSAAASEDSRLPSATSTTITLSGNLPVSLPVNSPVSLPGNLPVLAATLQTNGQGSGKKNTDSPPPSAPPEVILRGSDPWTEERVNALINDHKMDASWLPDIRATAPTHLQIQNEHQREMLRFSNSIANTGTGNLQVRRGVPLTDPAQIEYAVSLGLDPSQLAITSQEMLDSNGQIAAFISDAALSEFHPDHKHFHLGETAEFGVDRLDISTGKWDPLTGLEVVKSTFCLIDVNQIKPVPGNDPDHYDIIASPANQKNYTDCFADVQGISAGSIDRYYQSLPGQEVDVTNLAAGTYRLTTTVNPSKWFIESNFSNNFGFTAFDLIRDSNGNALVKEIPGLQGGLWFDHGSNGGG